MMAISEWPIDGWPNGLAMAALWMPMSVVPALNRHYLPDSCFHPVNFRRSSDDENFENHRWMGETMLDPLSNLALYEPPYVIHLLRLPLSNATDLSNLIVGCDERRKREKNTV